MNIEISPVADLALRKHVERAVRPVRAGKDRKLAIREELLAHLTAIYLEERVRQPDERAAVAATLERFGEPAELTAELDSSTGFTGRIADRVDRWEDSMLRLRWLSRREGESGLRLALRSFVTLLLCNAVVVAGLPLFIGLLLGDGPRYPVTLSYLLTILIMCAVSQAATIAVLRPMVRTFDSPPRSRWIRATGLAVLWSLFAALFTATFRWTLIGIPTTPREAADLAFSFGVGLSPVLVLGAWCIHHAKQYRKRLELWTSLTIDD